MSVDTIDTGASGVRVESGDKPFRPGRYQHYKGPEYEVMALVKHSETEEELVLYKALYGEEGLWVRPRSMFFESVVLNGKQVPRFKYMGA